MKKPDFIALNIAVLTVSDTRDLDSDTSGAWLAQSLQSAGHYLHQRVISKDCRYQIRAQISQWIADEHVHAILTTGGTGFYHRDVTPEAVTPLFDVNIAGFGELFRQISYQEIGTATMQSRAVGGMANGKVIFCLPGSNNACKTAWDKIIAPQLDARTRPCHFVSHIKK